MAARRLSADAELHFEGDSVDALSAFRWRSRERLDSRFGSFNAANHQFVQREA